MEYKRLKLKNNIELLKLYPRSLFKFFPKLILECFPFPFLLSFPRIITIFATEQCNMRCSMCLVQDSRKIFASKQNIITFNNLLPTIEQARRFGTAFYFTGGEPLLNKDLSKIITYLSEQNMITGLTTNGYLLSQKAKQLVLSGLTFLSISLDGLPDFHDKNRGIEGSYTAAVQGIKAVQNIKKKNHTSFPIIKTNTTFLPDNLHQVEDVIREASALGVDEVSFQHLSFVDNKAQQAQAHWVKRYPFGNTFQGMPVQTTPFDNTSIHKLKIFLQAISSMEKQYQTKITVGPHTNSISKYYMGAWPGQKSRCTVPWSELTIRANGDIELCHGLVLGNILQNTVNEVWLSSKAQEFRRYIRRHPNAAPCFRCCALKFKF